MGRLHANLHRLRFAVTQMRLRGHTRAYVVVWQLLLATVLRGWRVLAQILNARLVTPVFNSIRFAAFQQHLPVSELSRVYIVVMPCMLHFLLPCLALLHARASLVLVFNGAKAWERELLLQRLPNVPMFRLNTLPGSSLSHGCVINLLLEQHRGDFVIVDHDTYMFDPTMLPRLRPTDCESVVGIFAQHSRAAGQSYPLTHLLGFNADALRQLMHRHSIDSSIYRTAPERLAGLLNRVGLGPRLYLKDYQDFHDTLHVLLAVAMAEGRPWRIEPMSEAMPVMHVGGTSIGSHHTKNLFALYIHMRFIELLDDPLIARRYAFVTYPLRNSVEALQRCLPGDPDWQTLPVVNELIQRLHSAGAGHGFRPGAQVSLNSTDGIR